VKKWVLDHQVELRFRTCDAGLYARIVWTELFQIYRRHGDLMRMDSMLCDLNIITSLFQQQIEGKGDADFVWACNGNYTEIYRDVDIFTGTCAWAFASAARVTYNPQTEFVQFFSLVDEHETATTR